MERETFLESDRCGHGRRNFLKGMGISGLMAMGLSGCGDNRGDFVVTPATAQASSRVQRAIDFRTTRARLANANPASHVSNGDEARYSNYIASFSKTLPHNDLGEVDPSAFQAFVAAMDSFDLTALENVPRGGTLGFANSTAGQSFTLLGVDGQSVTMVPAPTFESAEHAAEMVDLYWQALCRDIPFTDFGSNPTVAAAAGELSSLTDYRPGAVTPSTVFRGILNGDKVGPYISQFLYQTVPFGALSIEQQLLPLQAGLNYMTTLTDAVNVQRGIAAGPQSFGATRRYISNFRDLAAYVHVDALHQAYLQAALILLGQGVAVDSGFPLNATTRSGGFVTFGGAAILGLVTEVAVAALKATWYQKWNVHRRLRPEAMGIRTHVHRTGGASYPIHSQLLNSNALTQTFNQQGTYLLSQAYPEGSPTHPSYGAGHAAVAGACTTVLKALFNGNATLANPVQANQSGTALVAVGDTLTVNGELNKLCSNISIGRNAAGVHYITDYSNCITLGEQVAVSILLDTLAASDVSGQLTLEKFDGTTVTLSA